MKNHSNNKDTSSSAASLVELLAVIAVVAIIGAIAVTFITNPKSSLEDHKLMQDVARLNSAVSVFLSNGGSLDGITEPNAVITELKKSADSEGQEKVVGLRGSHLDNRLKAVVETSGELRDRASWNPAKERFEIHESTDGIREFELDESLAGVDFGSAPRGTRLLYNDQDGWVWESLDFYFVSNSGPSSVPTLNQPTLDATVGNGSGSSNKLGSPIITPASGSRSLDQFPLHVSIMRNPLGPSDVTIHYSVQPNVWIRYSSPFLVEPGTSVYAIASNENPEWEDSDPATATFANDPIMLDIALNIPKNPINFVEAGGQMEDGNYTLVDPVAPISVSIPSVDSIPEQYETSDYFRVHWTYDGSDPLASAQRIDGNQFVGNYVPDQIDYTLPVWNGATLLPIKVVAQSLNTSVATDSEVVSAEISIEQIELPKPAIHHDEIPEFGDTVTITNDVDSGLIPLGARIYYTVDGSDPGDDGNGNPLSGTLYTGPFDPLVSGSGVTAASIVARAYPPQEHAAWFEVSSAGESEYDPLSWEISGDADGFFSNPQGSIWNGEQLAPVWFQWRLLPVGHTCKRLAQRQLASLRGHFVHGCLSK